MKLNEENKDLQRKLENYNKFNCELQAQIRDLPTKEQFDFIKQELIQYKAKVQSVQESTRKKRVVSHKPCDSLSVARQYLNFLSEDGTEPQKENKPPSKEKSVCIRNTYMMTTEHKRRTSFSGKLKKQNDYIEKALLKAIRSSNHK